MIVVVIILLLLQFWLLLRSSAELMHEAKRKDEQRELGIEGLEDYVAEQGDRINLHIPPPPPPNVIYKLKIALGFIQITTNLAFAADVPWPSGFKEFISWLNVFNFDFVKISALECLFNADYYVKFLIFSVAPLALFKAVVVFYLVPKFVFSFYRDLNVESRTRSRRRFWRMFLFTLFLIYPTVSAVVLR